MTDTRLANWDVGIAYDSDNGARRRPSRHESSSLSSSLSVLQTMSAKRAERRHIFLLNGSVVLAVVHYGLDLTAMAQTNLPMLDRVQNEAMRIPFGTTKNTPVETMRFMLDLAPMQSRQNVVQVKAYFNSKPSKTHTSHSTKL